MPESERLVAFDALAAQALQRWGVRALSRRLVACRENAVYEVLAEGSRRMALRIHRHGYHDRASLQSELTWMQALAQTGVGTPTVILAAEGASMVEVQCDEVQVPHLCDMLGWIEGRPFGFADDPASLGLGQVFDRYRTVGRVAAQIHRFSEQWEAPEGFVRPRWDRAGCLGPDALWGPWDALAVLAHDERATLQAAIAVVDRSLQALGHGRQVFGMIHADLVPDNLMEQDGRIVLLDFDDSGHGWYLFELATAVFWYLGTPHYTAALEGYVDGYRALRPLDEASLRLLPQFLLVRALVYMGWMQTRSTQHTARRLTGRIRELSALLARQVLAEDGAYRAFAFDLQPLPVED